MQTPERFLTILIAERTHSKVTCAQPLVGGPRTSFARQTPPVRFLRRQYPLVAECWLGLRAGNWIPATAATRAGWHFVGCGGDRSRRRGEKRFCESAQTQ